MKRSTIISILIILVLVIGGIYWWTGQADAPGAIGPSPSPTPSATPAPTPSPSGVSLDVVSNTDEPDAFVTYSDSGYAPASVTIKKGDMVRFVNNSNREMWPASAIHPTHAVYPQKSASDCLGSSFDACKAVPPGGSWEFTLSEIGTWRYHDHLSASKTGTIVVTE